MHAVVLEKGIKENIIKKTLIDKGKVYVICYASRSFQHDINHTAHCVCVVSECKDRISENLFCFYCVLSKGEILKRIISLGEK